MAKKNNTADIGFEKEIWKAADLLRGNLDASEYKSVVLGLIFLKYISDRFEAKYNELVEEGDGFEEDKDEYTSENIFFVPQEARWAVVAEAAHTPEVGTAIDNAMRLIEKENPRLKGILPKNFARPELDKRRLGDVVDLFTNIQMKEHGDSKDILGRTYEYCLSKFAEAEGKLAGEFYTPACIVRTLVEVLQPYSGRVYDPCCGSGGMFVQSAKFINEHQGNINNISVFGQDSNPTTWKMAQMNLAIRGIEADLGKFAADTFFDDQHPTLKADYIWVRDLSILNLYKTNYIIFPDELRRIILTMANMSKEIAPKYEKDIHFIINEKNNDLNKAINLMNIFCYTISSYLNEQKKIFEDELCAFVKEEQKRIDSMIFHDLIR